MDIETDDGQRLSGKGVEKELLERLGSGSGRASAQGRPRSWSRRSPPKLVHKLMFSMPAGTPPDKVLAAVKNFAREEFGLKHRYAMVLHTDEPHPHVHMVVKAVSEQGVRLNIRKATLREWRREFARHLRALGVAANATDRGVRGESRSPKLTASIERSNVANPATPARELKQWRLSCQRGICGSRRARQDCSRREERWNGAGGQSATSWLPKDDRSSPHRSGGFRPRCHRLGRIENRLPRRYESIPARRGLATIAHDKRHGGDAKASQFGKFHSRSCAKGNRRPSTRFEDEALIASSLRVQLWEQSLSTGSHSCV